METKPVRTIAELAREACAVQNASNISGVARGFVRALDDLRAQPDYTGNDWLDAHPITRAWVDKLASLTGLQGSYASAFKAHGECARLAEGVQS